MKSVERSAPSWMWERAPSPCRGKTRQAGSIDYQIVSIMLYDEEQKVFRPSSGCETRPARARQIARGGNGRNRLAPQQPCASQFLSRCHHRPALPDGESRKRGFGNFAIPMIFKGKVNRRPGSRKPAIALLHGRARFRPLRFWRPISRSRLKKREALRAGRPRLKPALERGPASRKAHSGGRCCGQWPN